MSAGKITCRQFVSSLGDYAAGETSRRNRARLEDHLTGCARCAAYLRSYLETVKLAKTAIDSEPTPAALPEELVRSILARTRG
ncbi:MAG TPA: zf-HC2 domain-containing protein [Candidatus Binataceae bacterium]|nr:zf-HC2 domain-containing protein [Candidatus Binataceae bacterium]